MRFLIIIAMSIFSLAALALPRATSAQSQPANPEVESVGDHQNLRRLLRKFLTRHDAARRGDDFFAEDADFTNMRGIYSHGRKDIETWFAGLFKGKPQGFRAHGYGPEHSLFQP